MKWIHFLKEVLSLSLFSTSSSFNVLSRPVVKENPKTKLNTQTKMFSFVPTDSPQPKAYFHRQLKKPENMKLETENSTINWLSKWLVINFLSLD